MTAEKYEPCRLLFLCAAVSCCAGFYSSSFFLIPLPLFFFRHRSFFCRVFSTSSFSVCFFFLIVYFLSLEFLVFALSSRFFSHFWRIIKRTFLFHGALVIVLKHLSVLFSPFLPLFSLSLPFHTENVCSTFLYFVSYLFSFSVWCSNEEASGRTTAGTERRVSGGRVVC